MLKYTMWANRASPNLWRLFNNRENSLIVRCSHMASIRLDDCHLVTTASSNGLVCLAQDIALERTATL